MSELADMTNEELIKEYVDLCIWKNFAIGGDWGSGDWGMLNALSDELRKRDGDFSEEIIELYKKRAAETRKMLEEEENAYYGREQFEKDMKNMP